jgi:poly(3-hydroxybutyrate) depolymerase
VGTLLDYLGGMLCMDLNHVHVTGMSNGGLMAYELAMTSDPRVSGRFASAVPVAGNVHLGFARIPAAPIHIMDVHGTKDRWVPLNATTAGEEIAAAISVDGWKYTPKDELFAGFKTANGCTGQETRQHWPTAQDGRGPGLYCAEIGPCNYRIVQCTWDGNHASPGDPWSYTDDRGVYGQQLVADFLLLHPRQPIQEPKAVPVPLIYVVGAVLAVVLVALGGLACWHSRVNKDVVAIMSRGSSKSSRSRRSVVHTCCGIGGAKEVDPLVRINDC